MTLFAPKASPRSCQRRSFLLLAASGCVAVVVTGGFFFGGLRINTTPSEALGIWRIAKLDRPIRVSDTVFVCPPLTPVMTEGAARGYLRRGLCPGGFGPLIKTVIAVGGQRIDVGKHLHVDGHAIASSRLVRYDGQGRPLRAFKGGVVPAGSIFLHSPFPGSWDSRYFGPVPLIGVLGLAREVLTHAP